MLGHAAAQITQHTDGLGQTLQVRGARRLGEETITKKHDKKTNKHKEEINTKKPDKQTNEQAQGRNKYKKNTIRKQRYKRACAWRKNYKKRQETNIQNPLCTSKHAYMPCTSTFTHTSTRTCTKKKKK